jgi:hypothetical protein
MQTGGESTVRDMRSDINGLGQRVSCVELKHERCSGETMQRLFHVEHDTEKTEGNITKVFQAQEETKVEIGKLKTAVKMWGVILGMASPILAAIVSAVVARAF